MHIFSIFYILIISSFFPEWIDICFAFPRALCYEKYVICSLSAFVYFLERLSRAQFVLYLESLEIHVTAFFVVTSNSVPDKAFWVEYFLFVSRFSVLKREGLLRWMYRVKGIIFHYWYTFRAVRLTGKLISQFDSSLLMQLLYGRFTFSQLLKGSYIAGNPAVNSGKQKHIASELFWAVWLRLSSHY